MTELFYAALDTLTSRGYSNALEIANEIEATINKRKPNQNDLESDKLRLFHIIKQTMPTYSIGKKPVQDNLGNTIRYIDDRRELTIEAVDSKSRKEDLVKVRHIMIYFLLKKYSCSQVGHIVGGRDHSTAIHAKGAVSGRVEVDKAYRAWFKEIEKAYEQTW